VNGWRIKAFYSWFNSVNISREVLSRAENGVISEGAVSDSPTIKGRDKKPKFLKIANAKMTDWRPLRIKYGSSFRLALTPASDLSSRKIRIVYFINCYFNVNYVFMFSSQMTSLLASGIMANPGAEAHIVFSGTEQDKQVLAAEVDKIFGFSQKFRFDHHVEKLFEYPAIRKIWQVARENSEAFILYFHAKGITHLKLGRFRRNRLRLEQRLF
jgi:hypothetical protein